MAHRFNITAFAVLVIILCAARPVQAQENQSYAVSLSPLFGMVHGHAEELVYPGEETKAPLLSQLLWNMKPVLYYGFSLDLSQINQRERWGYFVNFSMKYGIPGISGIHENRDWQSVQNASLTDFSRHDNHTMEMFLLNARAGLSFPLRRVMLLKVFADVSFMCFSFAGMDGYGIYARKISEGYYHPFDDNPVREDFSGKKVISYTQEWLTFSPGVSFGYFFHRNFLAELAFLASPLVLCSDLDEHKRPVDKQFRGYMRGGLLIEPGMKLSFAAAKWLDISCELSWRHISGTKGPAYMKSPIGMGTWGPGGEAGVGLSIVNTSLALKIKL